MKHIHNTTERLEQGIDVTREELETLRAQVEKLTSDERTRLGAAIDTYVQSKKEQLDADTSAALLSLKEQISKPASAPKQTERTKPKVVLPFAEWMERAHPKPSHMRTFLKFIGVLDVQYLLYRMGYFQLEEKVTHTSDPVRRAIQKTAAAKAPVTKPTENVVKKVAKPKKPRQPKKTKEVTSKELSMEFSEKKMPKGPPIADEPTQTEPVEPEPLVLNDEPEPKKPETSGSLWFGDAALEDEDLLKTDKTLTVDGIEVGFESADNNGDDEILLRIGMKRFRLIHATMKMNLSNALQKARVDNGELYVYGSTAFGAITGKGYIAAEELSRIAHTLESSDDNIVPGTIDYHSAESTARNRTKHTLDVLFERVK